MVDQVVEYAPHETSGQVAARCGIRFVRIPGDTKVNTP